MKQVIRLLSYEYEDEDALERQLGHSMPDGIREMGNKGHDNTLRVITLPDRFVGLLAGMADWAGNLPVERFEPAPAPGADYATGTLNEGSRT